MTFAGSPFLFTRSGETCSASAPQNLQERSSAYCIAAKLGGRFEVVLTCIREARAAQFALEYFRRTFHGLRPTSDPYPERLSPLTQQLEAHQFRMR